MTNASALSEKKPPLVQYSFGSYLITNEERVILLVQNHSNLHYEQKVKKSPKKTYVINPAQLLETKEEKVQNGKT